MDSGQLSASESSSEYRAECLKKKRVGENRLRDWSDMIG
jgi:hypothetical protein